jgi:hypothetical protein
MKKIAVVKLIGGEEKLYKGFFKERPMQGKRFHLLAEKVDDDANYLSTEVIHAVEQIENGFIIRDSQKTYEVHVE